MQLIAGQAQQVILGNAYRARAVWIRQNLAGNSNACCMHFRGEGLTCADVIDEGHLLAEALISEAQAVKAGRKDWIDNQLFFTEADTPERLRSAD